MRRLVTLGGSLATMLALAYLLPTLGGPAIGWAGAETVAAGGTQGRLTLDPNQFAGPVREAYKYAGENPGLLAHLHCYCGCDKAEGHQSLLDCYRGMHASSCEICTGEVLMAKRMADQGSPVDQIRDAIRRNFAQDN